VKTRTPKTNRKELNAFIRQALDKIEATPIPRELLKAANKLTLAESHAVWIAAGIASQIGLSLALDSGRFVNSYPANDNE
jgi:hypothetical protein